MAFVNIASKAIGGITSGLVSGLNSAAKYAGAGQRANAVSAAAQKAAANFNQASADNANAINQATLANQYGFNSGQAALANDFSASSWERAAEWNEDMFGRSMQFNAEEAQKNRDFIERMDKTKYQRAITDMKKAGLNPVLAVTGNGISVGSGGGGASASISAPSMSGMMGQNASGGLLGANDASISGYTGQMEYYAGLMGLIGGFMNSMSSAYSNLASMPSQTIRELAQLLDKSSYNPSNMFYFDKGSLSDKALNYLGIPHSNSPKVGQRGYTKGWNKK